MTPFLSKVRCVVSSLQKCIGIQNTLELNPGFNSVSALSVNRVKTRIWKLYSKHDAHMYKSDFFETSFDFVA